MTLIAHWRKAWQELGASNPDDNLFYQLVACYSEPHRKYHTMQHLNECFTHLEKLRSLAEHPAEIELALWFHDAVYDTKSQDNEEKSAEWARSSAQVNGLSSDSVLRLYDLVMATRHNTVAVDRDAVILVDIDLAILGAEPTRFDEYEYQIREEYSWVPQLVYQSERRKVLLEFFNRKTIYGTEQFRALFEAQARDNIARSLARV